MNSRPLVAISMGDAAGIGPELCLRVLSDNALCELCTPVLFGDADILFRVADVCGLTPPERVVSRENWNGDPRVVQPTVVDCNALTGEHITPRGVHAACGQAAYEYIVAAIDAAQAGHVDAICTAPINKEAMHLAGIAYPGHTELLADKTDAGDVRMMFVAEELVVSLVTIHVPYQRVPALLNTEHIARTIALTHDALVRLGKPSPSLIVCGLNPHAGENGLFGDEDATLIKPAVAAARDSGIDVRGPLPPDTAFLPDIRKSADGIVAMYHDQGLIPFKMLAFDRGVNVTLGLPFVRTSPDHGTAFDIAWKGMASSSSMVHAMRLAARLAHTDI